MTTNLPNRVAGVGGHQTKRYKENDGSNAR
jgi:hypothetical protein